MSTSAAPSTPPPDRARYRQDVSDKALEFDFLIGLWAVEGTRFDASGAPGLRYRGRWRAQYLHDRRMVMDDFTILDPAGEEVSAFVTLRTYCDLTGRWELAGLGALQPAMGGRWRGEKVGAEMHLLADAQTPDGRPLQNLIRFHDIGADSFRWESFNRSSEKEAWIRIASLEAARVVANPPD